MPGRPRRFEEYGELLERFEAHIGALTEAVEYAKGDPDDDTFDVERIAVRPIVRWRHASDDYEALA